MTVELIQYMFPDGRQEKNYCDQISDDLREKVAAITALGMNFAAECRGREVVLFIEDPAHEEDIAIEFADNGPGENSPPKVLERMIRDFNLPR